MSEQSFNTFPNVLARQRQVIVVLIAVLSPFSWRRAADVQLAQEASHVESELFHGECASIAISDVELRIAVESSLKILPLIVEVARTS